MVYSTGVLIKISFAMSLAPLAFVLKVIALKYDFLYYSSLQSSAF